jgi:hypothetical protein
VNTPSIALTFTSYVRLAGLAASEVAERFAEFKRLTHFEAQPV